MSRSAIVIAAALAFTATLVAAPAQAQRARTFVASYGNDSNPCTFLSPCRNFQQAINTVAVGGEVTAIDSAGFGPVTIYRSVVITSPAGVEAGIVTSAGYDAVDIYDIGGSITVTLRGLTVEGTGSSTNGVNFTVSGSSTLEIIDCKFDNFTNDGILIQQTGSEDFHTTISNTYAVNNGHDGIEVTGVNGAVSISNTFALNNVNDGVQVNGNNAYAGISNTIASFNKNNGFEFQQETSASLFNVHADDNGRQGIYISNSGGLALPATIKNSEGSVNGINDLTVNSGSVTLINNNAFNTVLIGSNGTGVADGTNYIFALSGTLGSRGLH